MVNTTVTLHGLPLGLFGTISTQDANNINVVGGFISNTNLNTFTQAAFDKANTGGGIQLNDTLTSTSNTQAATANVANTIWATAAAAFLAANAAGANAATLNIPPVGTEITIVNRGATNLKLFPPSGHGIDALGLNANTCVYGPGGQYKILLANSNHWYTTSNNVINTSA